MSLSIPRSPQAAIVGHLAKGSKLVRHGRPPVYRVFDGKFYHRVSPTSILALLKGGWIEEGERVFDEVQYRLTAVALAEVASSRRKSAA
jgi:hypothetical protein